MLQPAFSKYIKHYLVQFKSRFFTAGLSTKTINLAYRKTVSKQDVGKNSIDAL